MTRVTEIRSEIIRAEVDPMLAPVHKLPEAEDWQRIARGGGSAEDWQRFDRGSAVDERQLRVTKCHSLCQL